MTRAERSLFHDVAFAYVRAYEHFERLQARGNSDLADAAFSRVQMIETSISVRELNASWRCG